MRLIVNDISWQVDLYNRNDIVQSLINFANLCKYIIKKAHNLNDKNIYSVQPVREDQYISMSNMKKYLKEIKDKECIAILVGVINNSPTIEVDSEKAMFLHGCLTYAFTVAEGNDLLVSIAAADWLEQDELTAERDEKSKTIKNIYSIEQSNIYKMSLGYRFSKSNPKHNHRNEIYSKNGVVNSPMDLDDEVSQIVLDEAIADQWIKDRRDYDSISESKSDKLYAKYNGKYYEYQGTDNVYHGYIVQRSYLEKKCSAQLLYELDRTM